MVYNIIRYHSTQSIHGVVTQAYIDRYTNDLHMFFSLVFRLKFYFNFDIYKFLVPYDISDLTINTFYYIYNIGNELRLTKRITFYKNDLITYT